MIDKLFKFTDKKNGSVFYSRHEKPDFIYGMSDEEIKEEFKITEINDKEEIAKHTWGNKE